ncbi:MAG: metallophosphoesterase [Anaerolineales bacterium]
MSKSKPSRRAFLRATLGAIGAGIVGLPAFRWYVTGVEPHWLAVERVTLTLPRLPRAFHGVTLAQLSDLHLGPVPTLDASLQMVQAAIQTALNLRPDLIALTGDFVRRTGWEDTLLDVLRPLSAPHGVFGVRGNHDWYRGAKHVTQIATEAGVRMLVNESVAVRRGGETLYLAGVDDLYGNHQDLNRALAGAPMEAAVVLLAHEPDFADTAALDSRVMLQLSGHSHGGQVRVPLLDQSWLPRFGQKYPAGLYRVGELQLYTNRGIGVVGPAIRFNCRPEVTLFTLHSA